MSIVRPESRGRKPVRALQDDPYALWGSPEISPTDRRRNSNLRSHRKALAILGADHATIRKASASSSPFLDLELHSDHNIPPSANERSSPARVNSVDDSGTFSKHYSNSEARRADSHGDRRRPSAASATTVSSHGSMSSANSKFRKRLQGFFGEEYQTPEDFKQDSDAGDQKQNSRLKSRDRLGLSERGDSDGSQTRPEEKHAGLSRPETPIPSSDITPWLYQSFNVSAKILAAAFFLADHRVRIFQSSGKRLYVMPLLDWMENVSQMKMQPTRQPVLFLKAGGFPMVTDTPEAKKRNQLLLVKSKGAYGAPRRVGTIFMLGIAHLATSR